MNENREIFETELSETEVPEGEVWEEKPYREPPMRWHKFQIYFSLWLAAFLTSLSLAFNLYSMLKVGAAYWNTVPAAYLVTLVLELAFMAAMISMQLCVRFKLARFRKNAPRLLLILHGMILCGRIVFVLAGNLSLGLAPFTDFKTANVIGSIFMILANNKYYYRRRHLFVN